MVKLLIGHKGSGKTKRMIELANETVQYKQEFQTDLRP